MACSSVPDFFPTEFHPGAERDGGHGDVKRNSKMEGIRRFWLDDSGSSEVASSLIQPGRLPSPPANSKLLGRLK